MPTSPSRRTEGRCLLDEGLSPKQVAASLGVNPSTVYRWREDQLALETSKDDALRAAPAIAKSMIPTGKSPRSLHNGARSD